METLSFKNVIDNFKKLCSIPRCSGNEKAVSDYIIDFAQQLGFEAYQDEVYNVIIKKPATKDYEHLPTVILQGHMDIVGVSQRNDSFNFDIDPIEVFEEEGYLKAKGTTLGADNGIALAYMMSLLQLNNSPHPPLEMLMTVAEETGMVGATSLKPGMFKGKILINLDSEDEGMLLASCAGGATDTVTLPVKWIENKKDMSSYAIKISGLKGGHSGIEIDKQRANAIVLIARLLDELSDKLEMGLVTVNAGIKQNAIPNEAKAIIGTEYKSELDAIISDWTLLIKNEYADTDPGIAVTVEKLQESYRSFMSEETLKRLIDLILLIPSGIQSTSMVVPGLVVSSNNPGILKTEKTGIELVNCVRSSVGSLKRKIIRQIEIAAERTGAKTYCNYDYPEWQYDSESKIRELCIKSYEKMYGKKPVVYAIHAGVECGIFKQTIGEDVDMISFGPEIRDAHTVNERMNIASAQRVWDFLLNVLSTMKES